MSQEKLEEGLRTFYDQMEERLARLSPAEQQQYLEGLFHAFDAMTRLCIPGEITPFEREQFIGSLRSWAYSKTSHLGLDDSRMKLLVESDSASVAKSFMFAADVQTRFLRIPLDFNQLNALQNVIFMANIEATHKH